MPWVYNKRYKVNPLLMQSNYVELPLGNTGVKATLTHSVGTTSPIHGDGIQWSMQGKHCVITLGAGV